MDIQCEFAGVSVRTFRLLITPIAWLVGCCDNGYLFESCTFLLMVRVWDGEGVSAVEPFDWVILVDLDM